MAKEFFASTPDGIPQMHSRATDVWAYGMVVYVCIRSKIQGRFSDIPFLGAAYLEGPVC